MTSPRKQSAPFEPTPPQEIFAAYTWTTGRRCYRCGRVDVETAPVGRLMSSNPAVDVPACPSCVLALERMRETAAQRYGWPYHPGTPAERL
jgi:hypothetical protein